MAVEFELSVRPLRGRISRTPRAKYASRHAVRAIVMPDSLYREAVRRTVGALIEENKRLRSDRQRQAAKLTTMLAKAAEAFLRERSRRR